jgi:uncharacterized protein YndB with AHSA1/START domain
MTPNGKLVGSDLTLTRFFRASADDVWASVTEPERTARWFGTWKGEGGTGSTIQVQMGFEDGTPWMDATVNACEPPRRLDLTAVDSMGRWHLELLLTEVDGGTELALVHHLESTDVLENTGPGWEYYLDQLVASREGTPLPDFTDYYPSMKAYYEGLR